MDHGGNFRGEISGLGIVRRALSLEECQRRLGGNPPHLRNHVAEEEQKKDERNASSKHDAAAAAKRVERMKDRKPSSKIFVKTLFGSSVALEVDLAVDDVLLLKEMVQKKEHIDVESQRLIFEGQNLDDQIRLADSNLGDNSEIMLVQSPTTTRKDMEEKLAASQKQISLLERELAETRQQLDDAKRAINECCTVS